MHRSGQLLECSCYKISELGFSFSLELKEPIHSYQDPFLGKTHGGDTNEKNESRQEELKTTGRKEL
jgi:hypothetical protein